MKVVVLGIAGALALVVNTAAQAQTAPPAQAAPAAAAAPIDMKSVAGKWTITITGPTGAPKDTLMSLTVAGTKIVGTFEGQNGPAAVAGDFADGKVTFTVTVSDPGGTITLPFTGKLKEDGTSMSGKLALTGPDNKPLELDWKATRYKEKK